MESTHLNSTILSKNFSVEFLSFLSRFFTAVPPFSIVAYKLAASGLKVTREHSGLSVETVDDAMEEFQNEVFSSTLITLFMN
jgi:hypothetical protein